MDFARMSPGKAANATVVRWIALSLAILPRAAAAEPAAGASSRVHYLDPWTCVHQSDAGASGMHITEPARTGYWPIPCGLADPLAKKLAPRIIHTNFYIFDNPQQGWDENAPNPVFKTNQVGYLPWAKKFVYMGAWLGPELGAWKPHPGAAASWQLVDAATGAVVLDSPSAPVQRIADGTTKEGTPFTGEITYEMDFSAVTAEGTYFVRVPGVGRSRDFKISAGAAEEAFRVHMSGLYQKRCGIAKEEPYTHWIAGECHACAVRGNFPPEEGTLSPKTRWFGIIAANTDWEHAEKIEARGGWHDAADYDRRPAHLAIVGDLCAVYLLKPENFRDGQLLIPENENGIPDILDEAEWGLRHLLAVQQKDGGVGTWFETTGHPGPGNVAAADPMRYAVSRATRRSSLMYAAHAALLARCNARFREKYEASAIAAWDFALRERPKVELYEIVKKKFKFFTERESVVWRESEELDAMHLVKAAVNLHALTRDEKYIDVLRADMPRLAEKVKRDAWNWPPLVFAGERTLGEWPAALEDFYAAWQRRTINVAKQICTQIETSYAYRAPWWAPQTGHVHAMSWGTCHPLRRAQYLVAAHAMTGESKYLEAAALANDFHNGCNPQGTTLTSGLGSVYPVAFLDLPSYIDGIAEYTPGITPYRWTYGMPAKAVAMVYGGNKDYATKWPIWRRWGNLENQTVAASEYTVWETIAPAASVTAYLMSPGNSRPAPRPRPAKRLGDLEGYWVLP